nr:MAG TPA: GEMININ, MULTICILIN CYCLE, DNA REPLICATION LICENSING [Caudoviricetes sp.]
MTREEFIKQRCEIDKITEEEFEKRYRVVKCNCGQPYCKGYRCLDLNDLLEENQELKEKIEKIREIVENSDWRLDDVHDLIDGYDEIAKIII